MVRSLLLVAVALVAVSGCGGSPRVASTEHGEELLRSGEYDQAIGVLTEAIRIEPHNANAYLYRGRAYQCRNGADDLDNAINDFTTAIELDPKDHEAYYSRSIAYRDRGAAMQSEEDSARSAADHDMARKLDASIAETYQTMPEFTTPVEPAAPALPAAEPVAEKKPVERESLSDVRRRIEAAADQGGEPSTGNASPFGTGSSRRYSSDAAARARNSAQQNDTSQDDSDTKGGSSIVNRITRNRAAANNRIPTNPLSSVPPTLDPLSPPSPNSTAAPLTPFGGNVQAPHRGGTLPPVASSPYVAPTPYGLPQTSPYGSTQSSRSLAPGALQGAANTYDSASPYRTPYQSPFVRSGPAPTGIIPSQTLAPTTGTQQPRPYVTPIPGRINFPATTRGGQYNP